MELLVVVAIIGIVAAVAIPGLRRQRRRSLVESGARQVALALQNARMRAIAQSTRFKVVFEKSGGQFTGRYQAFQDVGGVWTSAEPAVRLPNNTYFSDPSGGATPVSFTHAVEPAGQAVYIPNGSLDNTNANPGNVFVADRFNTEYRLDVNQLTGNITIVRVSG